MKKKLLVMLVSISVIVGIVACGGNSENRDSEDSKEEITNSNSENQKEEEKEEKEEETQNSYTIEGITVAATNFSVEPYSDPNGEYTKRIIVNFTFTNDTDKAFGYYAMCEGYLSDGFKLESWGDLSNMKLSQIPSHGSADVTMYLMADDSVTLDKITAIYNFMDYNEEYWEDFGKVMTGEMGQEEYMSKYGNATELKFELTPQ